MTIGLRIRSFASIVVMAACVTGARATPRDVEIPSSISGQSAYGLFLAGQAAIDKGQGGDAADFFAKAEGAAGTDASLVRTHLFTAALLAGDVKQAAQLAPVNDSDPSIRGLACLTSAVEDIADGRGKEARIALAGLSAPYGSAAALLAPLAALEANDHDAAISLPVVQGDPVAEFFANLDQASIFEHLGRFDEAETALRALVERGDPGAVASLDLAAFLERRSRSADAVAIYDQVLARNPGDSTVLARRARAVTGHDAPPERTIRQVAAEALTGEASELIRRREEEGALAYLRLALRLDPDRNAAWLLVGDILSDVGDKADARAAYQSPKPAEPVTWIAAQDKLAWSFQVDGQKDQALQVARAALEAQPDSREAATNLADLLRADERFEESVKVLDRLIASEGKAPDWRLLYMRAVDYQQSHRWPQAELDLTSALKQRPDEPELLNFLGYSWIDRGERLHEALAMVQKAVNTNPKSGAMIDSLGWGYYRLGDYATAVEKLEQAVAIEAGDPDVNNHLGDAYWRVGRRIEARYQWGRVLTLEPDSKLRTEVEAKLKSGLGPINAPSSGS